MNDEPTTAIDSFCTIEYDALLHRRAFAVAEPFQAHRD
jgi:hypothetical protein